MEMPARILVVEDDTALRELLNSYLRRQGYDVIEACDSDVALRVLQSDEQIDLLLTDIVMPGKHDGFGLGKQARWLRPGLKVLHVTGFPDQIKANPLLVRSGALMQKPVQRAALLGRVGELLGSWVVDQNDILRTMYEYWVDKSRGRPLPDRTDLDPSEIPGILPYLSIVEVVGNEPRYRYRLLGTSVVEAIGFNPTNLFVDDVFAEDDAEFLTGLLSEVRVKLQPLYAASAFKSGEYGMSTERLLLPFSLGEARTNQIVVVQTFDWAHRSCTLHELARRHPDRTDAIQRPRD